MAATSGGTPHTRLVTVTTSPTLLTNLAGGYRSGVVVQNIGTVDVYLGGTDVAASGATTGLLLIAQASATTQPSGYATSTTDKAIYGVVAANTGTVVVWEEY